MSRDLLGKHEKHREEQGQEDTRESNASKEGSREGGTRRGSGVRFLSHQRMNRRAQDLGLSFTCARAAAQYSTRPMYNNISKETKNRPQGRDSTARSPGHVQKASPWVPTATPRRGCVRLAGPRLGVALDLASAAPQTPSRQAARLKSSKSSPLSLPFSASFDRRQIDPRFPCLRPGVTVSTAIPIHSLHDKSKD